MKWWDWRQEIGGIIILIFQVFQASQMITLTQKKDTYLLRRNKEERVENDRGDISRSLVVAIIL